MSEKQYVAYNLSGDIVPIKTSGGGGPAIDEEARAAAATAQTTAETAQSTADNAQSTAETAQSTATDAQNTANTALYMYSEAYEAGDLDGEAGVFLGIEGDAVALKMHTDEGGDIISDLELKVRSYRDSGGNDVSEIILKAGNWAWDLANGYIFYNYGLPGQKSLYLYSLMN